ncbi:unnamed protein product, partial [marine sediment metagenome]
DKGPILAQQKLTIVDKDTRESLTKKLARLGGKLMVETLKLLENEQIKAVSQPKKSPTKMTRKLTKTDGRIDWTQSPAVIERFIRSVTPWPGASAAAEITIKGPKVKTFRLKVLKAHLKSGSLEIDLVQLPGKNPISWKQFAAGRPGVELG